MAIEKKLICCKTQANFDNLLASGDIHNYSIVFIQDTQSIWTHGTYFSGTQALQDLLVPGANITMEANEDGTITISSTGGGGGTAEITLTAGDNVTVTKTGDNSYEISGAVYTGGDNVTVTKTGDNSYEISAASSTSDTIEAGTNITVTKDNGTITISGAVYNGGDNITITDNGNNTYTISAAATESETIEAGENITVTTDNGKIIISAKKDTIEAGENITVTSEDDVVTISAKDTTYTLSYDEETDELVLEDQDGNKSTVAISASGADTKNTAGALLSEEKLYLVGAKEQTENPETNSANAYTLDGDVYDGSGVKLANAHDIEAVRAELLNYMHDYCFMIRESNNADPNAREFYGEQSTLSDICSHFRMAAVRGQGDYDFLAPLRLTLSEDGKEIMIDGSDGDIMVATDTEIYLYSELITVENGNDLEVYGIGLTPINLYGYNSHGYEPFAMTSESVNCMLTPENTDHYTKTETVNQFHCIYNENIAGYFSTASSNTFRETYKDNGNGYRTANISTIDSIIAAQNKNDDPTVKGPWMGLYYRFVEIWLSAMWCELGHRFVGDPELFGTGESEVTGCYVDSSNSNSDNLAIWNYKQASSGYRCIDANTYANSYHQLLGDYYTKLPMLCIHRAVDAIQAKGNMGLIDVVSSDGLPTVFDEEGNAYDNINLNTGANMEWNKRYFYLRDVPGVESFSDGVWTGVVNTYIKLFHTSDSETYLFKISQFLYRGFNFCPGQLIWMQGFYSGYGNYYIQRDPSKIAPITSSTGYSGATSEWVDGYETIATTRTSTGGGWATACNPSVSLYCYTDVGSGTYDTYECNYGSNYSSGSNMYASAFGGRCNGSYSGAGFWCGGNTVSYSNADYGSGFALWCLQ